MPRRLWEISCGSWAAKDISSRLVGQAVSPADVRAGCVGIHVGASSTSERGGVNDGSACHWRVGSEADASAATQGRNPDELVRELLAQYFEEEARFVEAVKRGEEALDRGESLTHEQAGRRLERLLQT
jgi:hypothetical protein